MLKVIGRVLLYFRLSVHDKSANNSSLSSLADLEIVGGGCGRSRKAEREVRCERGYPLPTGGRVWFRCTVGAPPIPLDPPLALIVLMC